MLPLPDLQVMIENNVRIALKEDVADGDITAELIDSKHQANAQVITRDRAIICGQAWVNEVFKQVDPSTQIFWKVKDGDLVEADTELFILSGNARSLLTAERTALNFLQTLSATATASYNYVQRIAKTQVKLLDTRKTLPGLRYAQKYAVSCGGGFNHRIGLYDAYLIKENHIMACGGITAAVITARQKHPGKPVEVEVENFQQLNEAIEARADIIMLDNFNPVDMRKAVVITQGRAKLEASGNIDEENVLEYANTGVDFISIGALTKHCKAIDLSMRIQL